MNTQDGWYQHKNKRHLFALSRDNKIVLLFNAGRGDFDAQLLYSEEDKVNQTVAYLDTDNLNTRFSDGLFWYPSVGDVWDINEDQFFLHYSFVPSEKPHNQTIEELWLELL